MNGINEHVTIVLVEPQSPGNIGMVCRAMKNMGLTRLRLVKGCDRFHPESLKFAVSARDLLERAEVYDDLASALADCALTVGTTRRHGKYRQEILSPVEVATLFNENIIPGSPAAIVFGREDSGLTTDELSLCRWHATIPSAAEYGSLNLSQAVLVFCYELGKVAASPGGGRLEQVATSQQMESLFGQLDACLQKIGFLNEQNPAHIMRSMRRILFRATLDNREVAILRGMLTQIDWATANFDGRKSS
ncbi:RNA methyltransferase [Geobacter sp. SVR]|uniref:RNA methyltransferase n=1 Tax=Geobacter sp. SVR TaxID=2495594 RepID=UPI00143F021B|nr:RNA methyltransferase [Geobacter sp. SVR]BCS53019.1 tRNA (cytidine/uridine-2'-O-)-methyltransferase TrmJ [Geobacter sp. SVR]GCF84404.1 tRNA (cytidine/uridine-2'-O-)-methyltransferase TrmJ [Geobacter sp. SVR]